MTTKVLVLDGRRGEVSYLEESGFEVHTPRSVRAASAQAASAGYGGLAILVDPSKHNADELGGLFELAMSQLNPVIVRTEEPEEAMRKRLGPEVNYSAYVPSRGDYDGIDAELHREIVEAILAHL
jgi:hypothetical protein